MKKLSLIYIWLKAARLKLHILGILPVLVGSLIALRQTGNFSIINLIIAESILISVLIATAFANDYADVETDKINKNFNLFSGGSRVIIDGFISRQQMLIAVILASLISISLSFAFLITLKGHPIILLLNLIGLFVGIEYSLGPLKINYRGIGELLVVIMYSVFCLFFGYVSQNGFGFNSDIIYYSIPVALAIFLIILITEVPDCEADKAAGKKTIPTVFGKENSFYVYCMGIGLLYYSALILYLSGLIGGFVFNGLFFSLPLGAYLVILSLSKERQALKNISIVCGLTIFLNVWINVVLSLGLAFGH